MAKKRDIDLKTFCEYYGIKKAKAIKLMNEEMLPSYKRNGTFFIIENDEEETRELLNMV
jgi:hypothetical protein